MDLVRLLLMLGKLWLKLERYLQDQKLIGETETRVADEIKGRVNARLDAAIEARKKSDAVTASDPSGGLRNDDPNLRD